MAQTPEAKVKAFIDKFMKENFDDAWRYPAPGGQFGMAGTPDRLYLWKGVFIAIEAKADGNSPTELQWKQLRHIARQGGVAAVVVGKDMDKMLKLKETVMKRVNDDA